VGLRLLKVSRPGLWVVSYRFGHCCGTRFLFFAPRARARECSGLEHSCSRVFQSGFKRPILRRPEESDWELMRDVVTESVSLSRESCLETARRGAGARETTRTGPRHASVDGPLRVASIYSNQTSTRRGEEESQHCIASEQSDCRPAQSAKGVCHAKWRYQRAFEPGEVGRVSSFCRLWRHF
jgi:hypothetical protein